MFYLSEVENQVEFTNVTKIRIKNLNISLNHFQNQELVGILINTGNKV